MSDLLLLLDNGEATFDPGPIPGGSAVAGPSFDAFGGPAADEWLPRITAGVYKRDGTFMGALSRSYARTWQDKPDDTGTGSLTLQNDDADLALCSYGRVLRFAIDGETRFAVLIRNRHKATLASGEESQQATVVSGPGTLGILGAAIVMPDGPVDPKVGDSRVFGFASPTLPPGTVTPSDPSVLLPLPPRKPVEMPKIARWITTPTIADKLLLRQGLVVGGAASLYAVHIGANGPYQAFLDGQPIVVSDIEYARQSSVIQVMLEAGTHVLGIQVDAPTAVSENPAAIFAVTELNRRGRAIDDPILISTPGDVTATAITATAAAPKHWTAGSVMRVLITEAQDRGCFPDLLLTFTDDVDTLGEPWTPIEEFTVTVGWDLLQVVKSLAEADWGHFAMAPGAQLLHGYATLGQVSAAELVPSTDVVVGNLRELEHEGVM